MGIRKLASLWPWTVNSLGSLAFNPISDSTTALTAKNAAGTWTALDLDTTNLRVGVGGVPTTTFEVTGANAYSKISNVAGGFARLEISDGVKQGYLHANLSDSWIQLGASSAAGLSFRTADIARILLDSSGRFHLGATVCGRNSVLDINGEANISGNLVLAPGKGIIDRNGAAVMTFKPVPITLIAEADSIAASVEFSLIMDGAQCDMWYSGATPLPVWTTLYYTYATDALCKVFADPVATNLSSIRFPFVMKEGSTYYAFGTPGPGTGSIYMWSSTDKVTWTPMNGGAPVLTQGTYPYNNIANVGVVVVGTTWHMFIETWSSMGYSDVNIQYSYSTLADLNWDTHRTTVAVVTRGNSPQPVYVPDRNAIMLFYGANSADTGLCDVRAQYAVLTDDIALPASWHLAKGFEISEEGLFDSNPNFLVTTGKTHNITITYSHAESTVQQVYSDLSLNAFYDAITAATLVTNVGINNTAPQSLLHVSGTNPAIRISDVASAAYGWRMQAISARGGEFEIANTNSSKLSFVIDVNGNVSIGSASLGAPVVAPLYVETGGNILIGDAKNLVLGTTTGTQIGTAAAQKLSFYGATPVVQQTKAAHNNWAAIADVTAALAALGLIDAA